MGTEDILPTLLGLCGIEIPKSIQGLDYSAYLKGSGPNPNADNAALIECVAPFGEWTRPKGGKEFRGVRTVRYTYVRDLSGPWLLFDDEKDTYQQDNLVGKPEAAEIQKQLDEVLNRKLKAAGDEFLPAEKYVAKWGWKVDKNGTAPYTN
jgi:arylsulfatase A-like enzyme